MTTPPSEPPCAMRTAGMTSYYESIHTTSSSSTHLSTSIVSPAQAGCYLRKGEMDIQGYYRTLIDPVTKVGIKVLLDGHRTGLGGMRPP